jgi:hypothetical protein
MKFTLEASKNRLLKRARALGLKAGTVNYELWLMVYDQKQKAGQNREEEASFAQD